MKNLNSQELELFDRVAIAAIQGMKASENYEYSYKDEVLVSESHKIATEYIKQRRELLKEVNAEIQGVGCYTTPKKDCVDIYCHARPKIRHGDKWSCSCGHQFQGT